MAFIDGENLVARYQAMVQAGCMPVTHVKHRPDVYAWVPNAIWPGLNVVIRATYYTYCTGSADSVDSVAEEIRTFQFQQYTIPGQNAPSRLIQTLTPQIFWKQKNRSGKGVDIQMTVDILTNVYQNNVDTVFLVSGDGDYGPVVAECKRLGKQVFVAALTSGLSPVIRLAADYFLDLDSAFFETMAPAPSTP